MNNEALNEKVSEMKTEAAKPKGRARAEKREVSPRRAVAINMKVTDLEILLERIQSIGLGTVGDVAQILVKHPEAIELLRPFAKVQMKYLEKAPILSETALEKRLRVLKQLDPEKYKKIVGTVEA